MRVIFDGFGNSSNNRPLRKKHLDTIRSRSGVPTIEEAWLNAKHPNKYTTQEGMREIIKQERTIELAFEGYRNDDVRRWLDGPKCFNAHIGSGMLMRRRPTATTSEWKIRSCCTYSPRATICGPFLLTRL